MSVTAPSGRALVGRHVRLDPMTAADFPNLFAVLGDAAAYRQGFRMHPCPATPAECETLLRERYFDRPGRLAFTVRMIGAGSEQAIVGTTALLDIDVANQSIHLGATMYAPRWWGGVVNPETKLLLMGYVFDECGFGRLRLQTDALNTRSAAAIARLGAVREGVLRRDLRRVDGTFRDTVVFSVLREEWPIVQQGLRARIAANNGMP